MIAAETNFRDLMSRNTFHFDNLVAKSAIYMRLQQRGDLLSGEPTVVIKDMHAGGGIPLLM